MRIRKILTILTFLFVFIILLIPVEGIVHEQVAHAGSLENTVDKGLPADGTFSEKLAQFLTYPVVIPILLTVGSLGFVLMLYSFGFGIPGLIGLTSMLLFFYGHMVAGLAGFESLLLFLLGVGLLILELFVPGGIVGVFGFVAIISSFLLAAENIVYMGISLFIALFISILASILMVKVFGRRMTLFKKMILTDSTSSEQGYVSNENRSELLGLIGFTITPLRPAGTIMIDHERIDVVSEGNYVPQNVQVTVVKVEGSKIVVREIVNIEKK
ncbi:NfeD family protein [Bacillus sp. 03113]|uniref:NfeD family protein n=1 Tax=Bacillus sp. 03113 TaxID=2578211 RepID=UPI001144CCA5|nr:NfeD family protein [Bacillus sp. 03113]